jgi:hypothetical protein
MRKKLLNWGDILVSLADGSRIPKMQVITPFPSTCSSANSKKTILHGLSIPNPNFSEFAYFW